MKFIVDRTYHDKTITLGEFCDDVGKRLWFTVERPWVDADADGHRDRGVSRFLPGEYTCFLRKSHLNGGTGKRAYDVWEFKDVPDVTAAQIHIANVPADVEGCIGLGLTQTKTGVASSKAAVDAFMKLTAGLTEITVVVRDRFAS